MQTLHVDLGDRSYPIYIGAELFTRGDLLSAYIVGRQVAIVTNETVAPLYLGALERALSSYAVTTVVLPDGERYKTWETLQLIFDGLLGARHDRRTTVIALGGGVIGDMAGFAASCYQRGVNFIQVPTTLLSQVDSSVGGKTGINHPLGKNMVGAFYQPQAVLIDTATLVTLPARELSAGLAEVIKYGLICDGPFLTWLEEHMSALRELDQSALTAAISRSCTAKARVVAADERESGVRATLNLGHTFGHAIETHQGYGNWLHGEAVAAGTVMALDMSERLGWITAAERERVVRLFVAAGLPVVPPQNMTAADFVEHMAVDKKVIDGKLRLVLLRGLGEAVVTGDFPREILNATLSTDYVAQLAQLKINECPMTSLHADEAFLDHYHFTHDPFASRVPGFKFFPAQRKPVLGQLHHLARYSQLLLVVSGPDGSGKTLLRQALVASTNKESVQSVVVSAKGASDPASILRQVALRLQVSRPELPAILAQIGQLALLGQEVYVLVDDAEDLSDAALTSLLSLAVGNAEGRPHVFLFAESQLLSRLEQVAAGDECFHVIELEPYAEEETREYLAQRLEGAGQGIDVLNDDQVADIHEQSAGWPGAINQVAREVLVEAMLAHRSAASRGGFSFSLPRKHLLALSVVAIAVLAAWFMQGRVAETVDAPVVAQLPLGESAPPAVVADSNAPAIQFEGANQPLPLPLVGEAQPVIREPLAQAAGLSGAEESETASASVAPESVAEVTPVRPVIAPVAPPAPEPVKVVPAAVPEVKSAPVVAVAPAPAKPQPVVVTAKPVAADWYAAQAGSRFTLQILGARLEAGAQAFVKAHGADYRYFKKQHQGKPLYVVTYGSFATRDAAQAALRALPAKVQAGKPWPRNFAGIQQEMVQAR